MNHSVSKVKEFTFLNMQIKLTSASTLNKLAEEPIQFQGDFKSFEIKLQLEHFFKINLN